MGWIEKHQRFNFEDLPTPIHGLFFLDGAVASKRLAQLVDNLNPDTTFPIFSPQLTRNLKYPLIEFPSGLAFAASESFLPERDGCFVTLFGAMELPLYSTQQRALEKARRIAQPFDYRVIPRGKQQLELVGRTPDEHLLLTYDNEQRRLVNVEQRTRPSRLPDMLDEDTCKRLPKLYSQEHLELRAMVQVKFFAPDFDWTWYASEASAILTNGKQKALTDVHPDDPFVEDVLFFGLVDGWELELGHFSLRELRDVRGRFGFPIERDPDFTPTTLEDLQRHHRDERRGENDA
jgi:hypothetical protein